MNAAGMRAEGAATVRAGGTYVDVSRWICAPTSCPAVVGRLLVYRDDNHLTTGYPAWLAPVLAAELDGALVAAGSSVSPATSGPPVNPPSHGDPTNPAQPRPTG